MCLCDFVIADSLLTDLFIHKQGRREKWAGEHRFVQQHLWNESVGLHIQGYAKGHIIGPSLLERCMPLVSLSWGLVVA